MTVAIPCEQCGADFAAGNGRLCPTCRGGYNPGELRIPDTRGTTSVPLNNAARRAQGIAEDPSEPTHGTDAEYSTYLFEQMMLASGAASTSEEDIEEHFKTKVKEMFR